MASLTTINPSFAIRVNVWPRRLPWAGLITMLLMVVLTATASADLTNRKISGTMPAFGDAEFSFISPDGQYVVYSADQETDDIFELFVVYDATSIYLPLIVRE